MVAATLKVTIWDECIVYWPLWFNFTTIYSIIIIRIVNELKEEINEVDGLFDLVICDEEAAMSLNFAYYKSCQKL